MSEPPANQPPWYTLTAAAAAEKLQVDPAKGLSSAEAQQRLQQYGPNRLADDEKIPGWRRFLKQYADYMQIILVGTALVAVFIRDFRTALMIFLLTVLNAVIGMNQEGKAEASTAALKKMMKVNAKVRRDGERAEIPAEDVVPGDIVLLEAGDRVPADGRLVIAATVEVEEAALTGESAPVEKNLDPIAQADVPLGDRRNFVYMNTNVTRGRAELLVTTTGMHTEVGHIARMLQSTKAEKTPLQLQLDRLSIWLAVIAGAALLIMIGIGLFRGETFDSLLPVAVAMAIAAVPTGLPTVVTTMLSIGTTELAKINSIVKQLPSVETLGSTSAICSDKTGTLTLNQMMVRAFFTAGRLYNVTGSGYSFEGQIQRTLGAEEPTPDFVYMACALCIDAAIRDGKCVGDPTEGALYVLAQKGGLNVDAVRESYPRMAEVPFDSDYKFMATFHRLTDRAGRDVVRCYVKGAPDVITARAAYGRRTTDDVIPMTDETRQVVTNANTRLAEQGLRVLALAMRDFDPAAFDPQGDLFGLMQDLTLVSLVGIVDPPRTEAKVAIAEAQQAGIQVRMITGDHAVTAGAIAKELGIPGRAITGAEFAAMSDDVLAREIDGIGVIARVAPEHKVKLVNTLKGQGHVVAMTGDGVNDAPAIKAADIGIAMGITGTDVSKEASRMILTDDNFATIVKAVRMGRKIYDNLLKYIRFQLITLGGIILTFIFASVFNIAGGVPFTPGVILFINFLIDSFLGAGYMYDVETPGLMERKPRPKTVQIMTPRLMVQIVVWGAVMMVMTLIMLQVGNAAGGPAVGQSMALATFAFFHLFTALETRFPRQTVFSLVTFSSRTYNIIMLVVLFNTFLSIEWNLLNKVFGTGDLNTAQWIMCFLAALPLLLLWEIAKFIQRRRIASGKVEAPEW
jgi:P-type Ca2+ transporter type 2C